MDNERGGVGFGSFVCKCNQLNNNEMREVLRRLCDRVLGRKYYLVLYQVIGEESVEISSQRFRSKRAAELEGVRTSAATGSLRFYGVVSFRSKLVLEYADGEV